MYEVYQDIRSIRKGIKLAGVKVNYAYLKDGNVYSDLYLRDAERLNRNLYKKYFDLEKISDEMIKTHLNSPRSKLETKAKEILGIVKGDPIWLLGKREFLSTLESTHYANYVTTSFLNFLRGLNQTKYRKILTVQAFHEARHREYEQLNIPPAILDHNPSYDIVFQEAFVAFDELKLSERCPSLRPYIKAMLEAPIDPNYVLARKIARVLFKGV